MNHQSPVTNHQPLQNSIVLHNVSKKYSLSQERPVLLKNLFVPQKKEEVWALKNVTLTIKKGETIGIIGENGSGKSTLLKIIAGITTPTKGIVRVNGRVGSLIELGAGFHQDLTGRENIYLNGTLLGFTKKELGKKYDEIVEFADIGEYIDQPIRTYSSGMSVRLGFSVAVHLDPDILLIDEVLAVGDEEFQGKCIGKLREFTSLKKTTVIVSHDLDSIRRICNNIYLVEKGDLVTDDNPKKVIDKYINRVILRSRSYNHHVYHNLNKDKKKFSITKLQLLDTKGNRKKVFQRGERVFIEVTYTNPTEIQQAKFGIRFYSTHYDYLYGFLTPTISLSRNGGSVYFSIPNIFLLEGRYPITIGVANSDLTQSYDWKEQKITLRVGYRKKLDIFGSIDLNISIKNKKYNYL